MHQSVIRFSALCLMVALLAGCVTKQVKPQEQITKQVAIATLPIKPEDQPRMKALDHAMQAGDNKLAEKLVGELLNDYPNNPALHTNLGVIDIRAEQYKEALEHLNLGCKLDPQNAFCPLFKGQALMGLARYEEAEKAYKRALDLDPGSLYAHYGLGVIYDLYIIDYDKAEDHYEAFLSRAGEDVPALEIKQVTLWKKLLKRKSS